jgi:hypothetical protein
MNYFSFFLSGNILTTFWMPISDAIMFLPFFNWRTEMQMEVQHPGRLRDTFSLIFEPPDLEEKWLPFEGFFFSWVDIEDGTILQK